MQVYLRSASQAAGRDELSWLCSVEVYLVEDYSDDLCLNP